MRNCDAPRVYRDAVDGSAGRHHQCHDRCTDRTERRVALVLDVGLDHRADPREDADTAFQAGARRLTAEQKRDLDRLSGAPASQDEVVRP